MSLILATTQYAGAKREMSKQIIKEFPEKHSLYCEPFCGSLSVLFNKEKCHREIVNDINYLLINLTRVIQDDNQSVRLFYKLNRTAYSKELYAESLQYLKTHELCFPCLNFDLAYHYYIISWCGRGGMTGVSSELSNSFSVRYKPSGGDSGKRFLSSISSIPWWWDRLRGVTILNECGLNLLDKISDEWYNSDGKGNGNLLYIDSPYRFKNFLYKHDFSEIDHKTLSDKLLRFKKTKIVVSYDDCDLVRSLYQGWNFIVNEDAVHRMSNGKKKANELIIKNF